jgi:hypothetical protein
MSPIAILILAIVAVMVVRQFKARTLRPAPLVGVPLVLIALGVQSLHVHQLDTVAAALLAANVVISVALGTLRGRSEHVWRTPAGDTWRKGTSSTAALWAASIAARLIATIVARTLGVHSAAAGELELLLGISLAAQHAVIATRAGLIRDMVVPSPTASS